jgi:hypothetical protein
VSVSLSRACSVGVKAWRRSSEGSVSSSTLSPKSVLPFHGPLPVSISTWAPPGSTTGPPRERIAESLDGQVLGPIRRRRSEHSVLKTERIRPLARSISTTWPW